MRFRVGDRVKYNEKAYKVVGWTEKTWTAPTTKDEQAYDVKEYYDLQEENDKRNIIHDILGTKLKLLGQQIEFPLDNDVEYVLRNGLVATYNDYDDVLVTDDEITIPVSLYYPNGCCSACDDFDIVEQKEISYYNDDDDEDDEDDEDNEEDCDEDYEYVPYEQYLKDKAEKISLTSDDGTCDIQIIKSNEGIRVMGNIPDDKKDLFKTIIKKMGECL